MGKAPTEMQDYLSNQHNERWRRGTFSRWPKKEIVSPKSLAASGFIYCEGKP